MENLNLEKFSPTVSELKSLVEKSNKISVNDLKDKNQLEVVKKQRIELRDVRIVIEKKGKELRDDALKFQKAVIMKEKELIGIIEPEEIRLKEIEGEAKNLEIKEERMKDLSIHKEMLEKIGKEMIDDEILKMSHDEFMVFYNEEVRLKIDEEKRKIEIEKQKIQDEKDRLKREEERKVRDEVIRKKTEEETKKRLELETIQKEREQKEKEENERILLEKRKKYQEFLKKHNYIKGEDFTLVVEEKRILLYKKVGEFKK